MAVRSAFLKKRPIWLRFDIIPFIILYPLIFNPCVKHIQDCWVPEEPDYPSNSTFAFIIDHVDVHSLEPYTFSVVMPMFVVILHVVLLLSPNWSIHIKRALRFQEATEASATHVAFYPKPHHGTPAIVEYHHGNQPYAMFQQKKREYHDGEFVSISYPTHLPISEYLHSDGLSTKQVQKRLEEYGPNSYEMPIPSSKDLLVEQLSSPLFVFNVFSQICYLFDDFITTPLMSLLMSIFMQWNTVKTRRTNLLELRGSETPPFPVYLRRDGQWKEGFSDSIVPGDLVLITSEVSLPCDILLLKGRAVVNEAMLTGESTPQVKDPASDLQPTKNLDPTTHRSHILFGGTKLEQLIPVSEGLPKDGIVGYAISTGFGSSQGRLIRTILFASERVTSDSKDALKLLLFLSVFALTAGAYVWYYGIKSKTISTFRLIVEVLLILSSTIPPDLPMELSITINSSLLALTKLGVFCTEPYRIPYAGTIDVCCFDKTGTLTAEEYRLVGVDDMQHKGVNKSAEINGDYITDDFSEDSLYVVGGCHSLVRAGDGRLIGDSVEAAAFSSMKFTLTGSGKAKHKLFSISAVQTFHFSSELRRMTAVCEVSDKDYLISVTKGAPEVIADLLVDVPKSYFDTYRSYTRQGCRVLAMAVKEMRNKAESRSEAEKGLRFAGFLIFSASIKRGSEDTIASLLQSTHRVIVITGDDPLTACHVSKRLHIIANPPAIVDSSICDENGNQLKSTEGYSLCYTGKALSKLSHSEFIEVVKRCNVFARMSPQEKASIVICLRELGFHTLMCGDGTNDVGALKQAHVGMGLLEQSSIAESNTEDYKPKLGAASVASPFVTKRSTISSVIDIIRFGRATLSSTIDMFKQISLSCLTAAFTKSVLYIENVRFGDRQYTIFGLVLSIASMSSSMAKPLRKLSSERPFSSQFNPYLVTSVLLQSLVHFFFLFLTHQLVIDNGFKYDPFNYRAHFSPNLMNTAMFIITGEMDVVTNFVNYRGLPFMESISQNPGILFGVIAAGAVIVVLLMDAHPYITKLFQLVPYPTKKFQWLLILYCILDAFLTFGAEQLSLWIFSRQNRKSSEGLVEEKVKSQLDEYISNDDDVLPEELYDFGLMEMMKQNVEMQRQEQMKSAQHAKEEMERYKLAQQRAKPQPTSKQ